MVSSPYEQGIAAAGRGETPVAPEHYPYGSRDYHLWLQGFASEMLRYWICEHEKHYQAVGGKSTDAR